ncbi:MAG: very short patch repair endonuclease [Terracidiphilus sp.]|nr:very short patch repair endonuclease [Terracidiphilus sp.]MDR3799613.1 very short patch repair endonuclease [Terracidiphilus sp.]
MTDKFDPETRSRIMRAVRSEDTAPEILVRRFVHHLGYRFRLHRKDLPGKPDLVFPRLESVIFVHGCFWHGHGCPRGARLPKTNAKYWCTKIARNSSRDRSNRNKLRSLGWKSLVVWECELRAKLDSAQRRISAFLAQATGSCSDGQG